MDTRLVARKFTKLINCRENLPRCRITLSVVTHELFIQHASWCPKIPLKMFSKTFSWFSTLNSVPDLAASPPWINLSFSEYMLGIRQWRHRAFCVSRQHRLRHWWPSHRLWIKAYRRWITNNFPCKWHKSTTRGSIELQILAQEDFPPIYVDQSLQSFSSVLWPEQ